MWKLSKNSIRRRAGVDPRLIAINNLALTISPIDFGIPQHGGRRTIEDQMYLFKKGASKCDGLKSLSHHQSGRALDFYAFVDGKASWETEHLCIVGAAHLQAASLLGYKLQWGGLWRNFKDLPHIQLV